MKPNILAPGDRHNVCLMERCWLGVHKTERFMSWKLKDEVTVDPVHGCGFRKSEFVSTSRDSSSYHSELAKCCTCSVIGRPCSVSDLSRGLSIFKFRPPSLDQRCGNRSRTQRQYYCSLSLLHQVCKKFLASVCLVSNTHLCCCFELHSQQGDLRHLINSGGLCDIKSF